LIVISLDFAMAAESPARFDMGETPASWLHPRSNPDRKSGEQGAAEPGDAETRKVINDTLVSVWLM
jgi:hypothetical protein